MFGKNKAAVNLKTKKGRRPIRKVKVAIGAGALAAILRPFIEPWLAQHMGPIPEGFMETVAETLIFNYELIAVIAAAYFARPGEGDEPVGV